MSQVSVSQLAQAIHGAGVQMVLAASGGGTRALAELLEVPGASRSVLAATVPYSAGALIEWLGGRPDQFCSDSTARAMAMAAFQRARVYGPAGGRLAGCACTASLATDRPKRGDHRVHLGAQTEEATASQSLVLVKGRRTRAEEESLVAALWLNLIAQRCGVPERLPLGLVDPEHVASRQLDAPLSWRELLMGRTEAVWWAQRAAPVSPAHATAPLPHKAATAGRARSTAVFPGSFHPLHDGHRRMAQVAAETLGEPVRFELSILNVDKPPLDYLEIDERTRQFDTVWLTRAPTFLEKAGLFPNATFVVGADTLVRIADPRYYGGDPTRCAAALQAIADHGCRFLVFGRLAGDRFQTLEDIQLPAVLRGIARGVPERAFRADISSTALRNP